ncbi:hypothetical protein SRHO_G00242070 [Serrasalmus rhombeus]
MVLPLPARSLARHVSASDLHSCSAAPAWRLAPAVDEDMTPRGGLRFAVNRRPHVGRDGGGGIRAYMSSGVFKSLCWTGITAALSLVWLEVMGGRCAPVEDCVKVAGDVTTAMGIRNGRGLVAGV